jgi:hypothetical protein
MSLRKSVWSEHGVGSTLVPRGLVIGTTGAVWIWSTATSRSIGQNTNRCSLAGARLVPSTRCSYRGRAIS